MSAMLNSDDGTMIVRKPLARREVRQGSKIYFILCQATGRVKCGVGADPRARLASLQAGSPTTLKLIAEIDGDGSKERLIHRRLDQWHIHGEWFHYVPEVCDVIVDEFTSHLKDLYLGLYAERTKLHGFLPAPRAAVARDRSGDERIHRFLSDCTVESPGARTQSSEVYRAFEAW
jgi:hypothetical protein